MSGISLEFPNNKTVWCRFHTKKKNSWKKWFIGVEMTRTVSFRMFNMYWSISKSNLYEDVPYLLTLFTDTFNERNWWWLDSELKGYVYLLFVSQTLKIPILNQSKLFIMITDRMDSQKLGKKIECAFRNTYYPNKIIGSTKLFRWNVLSTQFSSSFWNWH